MVCKSNTIYIFHVLNLPTQIYSELYSSKRDPTKIPLVKGTVHGNKKPFDTKIKVITCTIFVLKEEEEDGEIGAGF